MTIKATARVQITVEVETSAWGGDCSISQLYKQAAESGRQTLLSALKLGTPGVVKIVGEPRVIGVITEKEAK